MENPKKFSVGAALLFLSVLTANASTYPMVSVGALCTNDEQCESTLLHCSNIGVCLCNRTKANSVVEFEHIFDIGKILCEVKECIVSHSKKQTEKECDMENANCTKFKYSEKGFCNCPIDQMGSRRKESRFYSYDGTECKSVQISSVGKFCSRSNTVCDTSKKLKCRQKGTINGGKCGCYEGHVFDYEKDYCVTKEEFTNYHGISKLGTYKQYCNYDSDCSGGMKCKSLKCDCPHFCTKEFIKTEDLCYCPTDYEAMFLIIIPVSAALLLLIAIVASSYIKRRNAISEETQQNETVLVIQPGATDASSNQTLTSQQADNLNLIFDEQQQNICQQSYGQQLPFNPEEHLQPTAPPYSNIYYEDPPSYSEVMQQQNFDMQSQKFSKV